jgi:hypothetical protein
MSQQGRFAGVKGDECQCGRRASVRHCPSCGSARIYGYSKPDRYTGMDGRTKLVENLYRCLSCSKRFIDEEREFCQAPPFTAALALLRQQRLHEAAQAESRGNPYLDPNVIAKAQELAGQEPDKSIEELKQASKIETSEVFIDPSISPDMQETAQEAATILEKIESSPIEGNKAARRAFLEEWSHFRYSRGLSIIKFQDFERRRLKGETVEAIFPDE